MLSLRGIDAAYSKVPILESVDLRVDEKQIVGVIGPNGAGKSTLLKVAFGYLRPKRGTIIYRDDDVTKEGPEDLVRRGIGYVPQAAGVFGSMSVEENLLLGAYTLDRRERQRALESVYQEFPFYYTRRRVNAGSLSGGERRILELARVMMTRPKLVLLDEPSAALSPLFVDDVYSKIVALHAQGTSFLIIEQNVDIMLSIADHMYALVLGKNSYDGKPKDFESDDALRSVFLGAKQK